MAYKAKRKLRRMGTGGSSSAEMDIVTQMGEGASSGGFVGAALGLVTGVAGAYKQGKQEIADLEARQKAQSEQYRDTMNTNIRESALANVPRNMPLMPIGGYIPYPMGGMPQGSETVELESGEPFMTPDGQIQQIPNNAPTHAQGGVPITLPSGTKVLGKKPATDEKTFKQLGAKLEKQQTKYQKILDGKPSRIEEQTAKRMLSKVAKSFDELFELQGEDTGIPQQGMPQQQMMPYGGMIRKGQDGLESDFGNRDRERRTINKSQQHGDINKANSGDVMTSNAFFYPNTKDILGTAITAKDLQGPAYIIGNDVYFPGGHSVPLSMYRKENSTDAFNIGRYKDNNDKNIFTGSENPGVVEKDVIPFGADSTQVNQLAYGGMIRKGLYGLESGFGSYDPYSFGMGQTYDPTAQFAPQMQNYSSQVQYSPRTGQSQFNKMPVTNTNQTPAMLSRSNNYVNIPSLAEPNSFSTPDDAPIASSGSGFDWKNALSTAATIAPSVYNLIQGSKNPDTVGTNAFANPYEQQIRSTMQGRRYNIQPEIEAARVASATNARRLREAAPTQAQYLGGIQAAAIQEQRGVGQALANKQNMDNQYLGEQAQMDARLGQANSERSRYIEDVNARNEAAGRQYTQQGLTQLGQYAQVKQQMGNQMIRDAQRLDLLPSLVQNFTMTDKGWVFKQTGEVMTNEQVMAYIKGTNRK